MHELWGPSIALPSLQHEDTWHACHSTGSLGTGDPTESFRGAAQFTQHHALLLLHQSSNKPMTTCSTSSTTFLWSWLISPQHNRQTLIELCH